jgi:hypothetical protein
MSTFAALAHTIAPDRDHADTLTFHCTARKVLTGFVPMVTIRTALGQMLGSRTPKGDARAFRTYDTAAAAESDAYETALRVSIRFPQVTVAL